jgi:cell division transport system permease protein
MRALTTWMLRHVQALFGAVGRLARSPVASLMTVFAIALALAMPLGLKLLVDNLRIATGDFADAVDLTVYFKTDVKLEKAQQLARSARQRRGVAEVLLLPADQGLEEFRQHSGFGAALEALEGNPLPHVLNVRPTAAASTPAQMENLKRYFAAWPEVEAVQVDNEWVQRFSNILVLLGRLLALGTILLAAGVVAIIGNTIRLEIQNRRAEIEVTKLVGGSNAFVRRPFLYTGALYAVLGAILALGLVSLAVALIAGPANRLAELYGSGFRLLGPAPTDIAVLGLGSLALGLAGAWISAGRQLSAIEPCA